MIGTWLAWIAWKDIKTFTIQDTHLAVLAALICTYKHILGIPFIQYFFPAAGIFLLLLLFSVKTDCLGGGDVKLCGVCCLYFTLWEGLYFICFSFIFLYIFYLITLKKYPHLPFAPFAFASYLLIQTDFLPILQ